MVNGRDTALRLLKQKRLGRDIFVVICVKSIPSSVRSDIFWIYRSYGAITLSRENVGQEPERKIKVGNTKQDRLQNSYALDTPPSDC
jgi:hypothetical protein